MHHVSLYPGEVGHKHHGVSVSRRGRSPTPFISVSLRYTSPAPCTLDPGEVSHRQLMYFYVLERYVNWIFLSWTLVLRIQIFLLDPDPDPEFSPADLDPDLGPALTLDSCPIIAYNNLFYNLFENRSSIN
jgi:hypothetical protein